MKKLTSILICLFLLMNCVFSAAAAGVPEEVMQGTQSVVRIMAEHRRSTVSGSGFVIQNVPGDVLIATNDHVVEDDPLSISVWIGQNTLVFAEVVCTTSERDLCILRVTDTVQIPALTLSTEDPVHGAAIYAVGYPGAGDVLSDSEAHTSESATITNGIISAIRSFTIEKGGRSVKLLQINAAINPGNSGGPLFNEAGEVIGINTYKVTGDSQGIFGSVAVAELWDFLAENNIELQSGDEPEETTVETVVTEETLPVEEPQEYPKTYLFIAAGAALCAVILLIVVAVRKKKKKTGQVGKGVTLALYLQDRPRGLGIGGAVRLLLPVAIQLRNMHNDGRLHLQVNPENILLENGEARLKDPTPEETGRYTSGFAAPEIYRGVGYGILSDVYSFGAVLYYAATGQVPANSLQAEKLEQDLAAVEHGEFLQLLRRCMALESSGRFQHMQELIFAIAGFNLPAPEIEEAPAAEEPAAEQPRKKSRKGLVFVLLLLVLLLAGGAFLLMQSGMGANPNRQEYLLAEDAPAGEPVAVEYAAEGDVTVLSATSQTMEGGFIRYTLTYQAPAGSSIFVSGSPEEEVFSFLPGIAAEGENTLIFDLAAEDAEAVASITVKFCSGETQIALISLASGFGPAEDATEATLDPYSAAEALLAAGDKFGAAKAFYAIEDNPDARARCFEIWDEIAVRHTVAVGCWHSLGVTPEGTVEVAGQSLDFWNARMPEGQRQTEVDGWTKIIAVEGGEFLSVGLRSDGTVVATGDNSSGQCDVGSWRDIVAIYSSGYTTMGLKADGTVMTTRADDRPVVSQWTDIVAISGGFNGFMGLKADGTVVTTDPGNPYSDWAGIVAISDGLGLYADGTVAVLPDHWSYQEISQWRDIVTLCEGHTGIRADGTVVTVGGNYEGDLPIEGWTDVVDICSDVRHVIGLKKDGTVIGAGNNVSGRISGMNKWGPIKVPDYPYLKN